MKTYPDIKHEDFCLPRPGDDAPRAEQHQATTTNGGTVTVTRCIECGAQRAD